MDIFRHFSLRKLLRCFDRDNLLPNLARIIVLIYLWSCFLYIGVVEDQPLVVLIQIAELTLIGQIFRLANGTLGPHHSNFALSLFHFYELFKLYKKKRLFKFVLLFDNIKSIIVYNWLISPCISESWIWNFIQINIRFKLLQLIWNQVSVRLFILVTGEMDFHLLT